MPLTEENVIEKVLKRRAARESLHDYIVHTSQGRFKESAFSRAVCAALDKFLIEVAQAKRPVLILQAPPQHGKSEMVSRKFPAYVWGQNPNLLIAAASYATPLAHEMSQHVRRNLAAVEHQHLWPVPGAKRRYDINRMGQFTAQSGSGSYIGVGVGSGLTGRPVDIGIIDDPIKDQQEALSPVTKESHWNWYQTVFSTRLSENSGQIIMATSWAEDDLPARIANLYAGDDRLTHLRFPAINDPHESGFQPHLPRGALVPELKSMEFLLEQKKSLSDYWWSALYQQTPKPIGGNVFKEEGIQYYLPKDLPERFETIIDSWDCTFKDTDGTDFVVGQKWGKKGANAYLLYQFRDRISFTRTCEEVKRLRNEGELISRKILIEDKANGPAVIDFLKQEVFGIFPVEPDGSKLARAHAVTSPWEAKNVWLPHPDIAAARFRTAKGADAAGTKVLVSELTVFNAGAHDDQVDALTQALRELYPLFGRLKISDATLKNAATMGRGTGIFR